MEAPMNNGMPDIALENNIALENRGCPIGCDGGDDIVLSGHDRLHGLPGEFTLVRCRRCGLMRTNPRPTPETIGLYYPDDYGPYQGTRVDLSDVSSRRRAYSYLKRLGRAALQTNTQCLPDLPPGRMLEIGCASGSFMHEMAARGWEVEGVEFSSHAAESARALGYPVYAGALESAPDPGKPYDLVVGWMVMEHLHDPVGALRKLHKWVKPGGWLAVSVPNAAALEFRFFKTAWYALQLPTHLYHYTPRTLGLVLQKGGWRMEGLRHQRVIRNLVSSTGYLLQDRKKLLKLAELLVDFPERAGTKGKMALYPFAYILSLFGQTGRMTVWARRSDDLSGPGTKGRTNSLTGQ